MRIHHLFDEIVSDPMKSDFTTATGEDLQKRIEESKPIVDGFPQRYHDRLSKLLPIYLRYGPPTWKLVYELTVTAEEEAHKARLAELETVIKAVRQACSHDKTHYDPDPSGNHDSTTTCMLCGKIL